MTNYNLNLDIDHKDYYYRITKNSRNHLVQQKVNRALHSKCDALYLNKLPYDTINNEVVDNLEYEHDHCYTEYLMSIVHNNMYKLDNRLQKIVSLRFVFNKSIREISKILHLSYSRTFQLYNRSIRLLKNMCRKELHKDVD